jgi:serine protease AprX
MYNVTQITGAQAYWAKGYTGAGIGVAVIDSGVAPDDGLTAAGKVVFGPDLSFESQAANLTNVYTFGHGTHMAGIIAGRADAAVPGEYTTDTTNFVGMAPDAKIISLKVADHDGATDVSQMIAAIDWVVQHRNDPGLNIRVLNLSYGTDSANDYTVDPLAYATEQAWKAGIFVVAASGNAGFVKKTGTMTMPAKDPNIMAVGATDTTGSDQMKDDVIPDFSSTGSSARRVDVVAPGTHIVSLRAPGSAIDVANASTGAVTPELFRGSGTSQATAVVSGAAALVIQQNPDITPSQLKNMMMATAFKLPKATQEAQGKGELDLTKTLTQKVPNAPVFTAKAATGTGTLDASRGSSHLDADGVSLSGEVDIFGDAWSSSAMAAQAAAGTAWTGGTFNGTTWTGSSWAGSRWSGASWLGSRWSGSRWSDADWSGSVWDGSRWSDADWSGSRWSGSRWSGSRWSDSVWSDASWS